MAARKKIAAHPKGRESKRRDEHPYPWRSCGLLVEHTELDRCKSFTTRFPCAERDEGDPAYSTRDRDCGDSAQRRDKFCERYEEKGLGRGPPADMLESS